MEYFSFLSELQKEGIFYKKPVAITKLSAKHLLDYALGATLYMPATRGDISEFIITKKYKEICSMVICLEDSIGDAETDVAEERVVKHIQNIYTALDHKVLDLADLPLIFIRIRSADQMRLIADRLGDSIDIITGFVFPKFTVANAIEYLECLEDISKLHNIHLYGMPILETPDLLYKEVRMDNLLTMSRILEKYENRILNIRIGATDLCGLYGIRRNCNTTIYDIAIIRDLITDIINLFGRKFVISGPVWEYFDSSTRILKPQLRQSPFRELYGEEGLRFRTQLLNEYADGLIKETLLDLANGLNGKTVIHPSHLKIIQSLNVISKEEYLDAVSIIQNADGNVGVLKSTFSNKMNEIKPHYKWANKIILKSKIYGVYHENHSFIDLLTESTYTTNP
ncbi:HpcH/HpaI aldolase/citrate lyase family protein [Bacillus sp. Marseille-P3661]|uniref:HpcH/HpaI aldolase/citrate lyase family protein n=1 Tax=Bacillus sp. Marseille-P3661 TaxID=1936234 RepID=UPI000C81C179|nr:HpcH/HpaI aldolase/citrate lyase family protein [Bacillus sp. Marseille-P3661]